MGWNIARVQSYIVRGSFYAALPDKKHNIVELNSCVVLFVFNIIYVIKGGVKNV